ncbi:MAG: META domain-containing protein [Leucobacter sp.]
MKKKLSTLLLSVAAVAALGLTACSGGSASVVGVWGQPEAQGEPSLEFQDDGRYAGTDGCNRLMGSWTADGDSIDLGEMASTMMFCEGVDDWLNQGVTATLRGDTLVIADADGQEIGTLDRQ